MIGNVSFGQRVGVFENASGYMDKPQAYTKPNATPEGDKVDLQNGGKKKKSVGKTILAVLGTAVAAAGLLALGKKFNVFNTEKLAKLTESFKDKKWISWAKKPVKAVMNGLDKAGAWVMNKGEAVVTWAKNLFNKAPQAAEEAAAIVA